MNDVTKKRHTKILFWIDVSLIQFGIAKMLQKKIDGDFYVIYDLSHHLKKSFMQQKIINFKKEWYFWDYVGEVKEPDIEYLKQIEKKYGVNLWEIAYAERNFYKYNPFYKFSRKEILSIFEQECRFFEKVINEVNPNFLIIKTTDFHRNYLLTEMCRAKNIKILMLITSRLANKASIASQSDKIDYELDEKIDDKIKNDSFEELREYFKKRSKSQQKGMIHSAGMNYPQYKKILPGIKWLTETVDKKFRESYDHYGVTRLKAISHYFLYSIKGKIRKRFIDKKSCKKINLNKKFIFFPLQVQPERNVDIDAPFYANQIEVVTNIAKALPVDYKLFVKEHPLMRYRHWREIKEYREIISLPNVELIHPEVSPKEILENCSIVITIAGSVGLESALYRKAAIVFTDTIYASLPSVHRLKNLEELPDIIKKSLDTKVKLEDINEFINLLERNSFEFDMPGHYTKILEKFHSGGFMISNKISMEELDKFINDDKNIYEMLSDEHIKKMNKIKKYEG
jgi:hypothetical protein